MRATSLLVDLFDFYGKEIPLQIFSAEKKKSIFGALMGVLSLFFIGAIIIYFLISLFSRDTKQIITNQTFSSIPSNNLSNVPFMMTFNDPLGNFVSPDAGIWEIKSNHFFMDFSNGTLRGITYNYMDIRRCTKEDAGGYPVSEAFLSMALCVPFGKYNLNLNGMESDITNGWNSIYVFINRCNNQTNSKCQNDTVITNIMEKGYFNVFTFASVVDNNDNNNPSKVVSTSIQLITSFTLFKQMYAEFTQTIYTDDVGFVFESLVTHNFFTLGEKTIEYSLGAPQGLDPRAGGKNVVGMIVINNSRYVVNTKRTFLKAQAVLANIGGIVKFVMVLAQIITQIVTRKDAFIQIGNEVFSYHPKKKKRGGNINNPNTLNLENEVERKTENAAQLGQPATKGESASISLKPRRIRFTSPGPFVRNKKVMDQYEMTRKIILEKISIHSLLKDSYKLDKLTRLALNDDNYNQLNDYELVPIGM